MEVSEVSERSACSVKLTYTLFPGPVTRHEVAISAFTVLKVLVRNIVNIVDAISQIRVGEDVVDKFSGIAIPELIFGGHPLGCGSILWAKIVVLGGERLPRHMPKIDCINRRVEVFVVEYWSRVIVGDQCGTPEVEKSVENVI